MCTQYEMAYLSQFGLRMMAVYIASDIGADSIRSIEGFWIQVP